MSDSNNMPPGASEALDRIHEAEDAAAAARDAVYKAVYRSMVDGLTAGDAARLVYTPGYTTCSYKSLRTVLDESGEHTAEIIGLLGRLARGEGGEALRADTTALIETMTHKEAIWHSEMVDVKGWA